jgi:hypothetical protein
MGSYIKPDFENAETEENNYSAVGSIEDYNKRDWEVAKREQVPLGLEKVNAGGMVGVTKGEKWASVASRKKEVYLD